MDRSHIQRIRPKGHFLRSFQPPNAACSCICPYGKLTDGLPEDGLPFVFYSNPRLVMDVGSASAGLSDRTVVVWLIHGRRLS